MFPYLSSIIGLFIIPLSSKYFKSLIRKIAVVIEATKSDTGPAAHTPVRPKNFGSMNKAGIRIKTCLDSPNNAACLGFPVAWK